jgi:hypothetical protein
VSIDKSIRDLVSYRLQPAGEALHDAAKIVDHEGTPRSIVNRS